MGNPNMMMESSSVKHWLAPLVAGVAASLLLAAASGCVTPQKFRARLEVMKDGGYVFSYDGTYLDHDTLTALGSGNDGNALLDMKVTRILDMLTESADITAIEHVHKGLYNISFRTSGNVNRMELLAPSGMTPIFSFQKAPGKEGYFIFEFNYVADPSPRFARLAEIYQRNLDGVIEIYSELPLVIIDPPQERDPFSEVCRWKVDPGGNTHIRVGMRAIP